MATPETFFINSITPSGSGRFYSEIDTNQGKFWYVPREFVYQGLRQGENQFFDQSFLNKEYLGRLKPIQLDNESVTEQLRNAGYANPGAGFLISDADYNKFDVDPGNITYYSATGKFAGPVRGIAERGDELVYSFEGAGGSTFGVIDKSGTPTETTRTVKNKFGFIGDIARGFTELVAGIPLLPEIVGFATGNPYVYGSLKAAQTAGQGGDLGDVLESGAKATASALVMKNITSSGGSEGAFGGDVEVQPGGFYGEMPTAPSIPSVDYSLIGGTNFPPPVEGMGGGTGITPGTPGVGLQQPTMPNIAGMGGGQGLTVPVDGGTVGQLGFTPASAVPVLGSPSSFINNPEVIGQPVLAQGSPEPFLSVRDALRGLNLASQLGAPQQQLPTQPIGEQATPATGVDYSGLLGLLATRAGGSGLLGTRFQPQPINLTSLLG